MRLLITLILSISILISCKEKKETYVPLDSDVTIHHANVKEVIQGGTYTFLRLEQNNNEIWMATNKTAAKAEEVIYYKNPLLMKDFKSKELGREFEEIYFVQSVSKTPDFKKQKIQDTENSNHKLKSDHDDDIMVDRAPNGITIGMLYKQPEQYANKKVIIRGKVVKINENIMDRNWVHLKDGTNNEGKSDLTITTLVDVNVGDIVTFEGIVAVDKEFGAGYVYPLIVEGGILK